jgi:hypothetical protein
MEITSPTVVSHPFMDCSTIGIYGPSGSGKSTFIKRILENRNVMFETEPCKIMYCYGIWSDNYENIENVTFTKGLPSQEDVNNFANGAHNLIILDDLMREICQNPWTDQLFTMCSHHLKLSVIFVSQNLFPQSKNMRNIALNMKYIVIFSSPRDIQQVGILGSQLGSRRALVAAYTDAVLKSEKFNYLLIDLTPSCINEHRWRTKIFPGENTIIYL